MMMGPIRFGDLERIAFFDNLTGGELDHVYRLLARRSYGKGDLIFQEGDPGDELFFLLSGIVRLEKRSQKGRRRTLGTLTRRSMFGDMAMVDGSCRSAAARAMSDVEVATLHRNDMAHLLESHPRTAARILMNLLRLVSLRLRKASADLVDAWSESGLEE